MSVQLPLDKIPTGDSVSYPQTRYSFTAPSDAWIRYALEGMMSLYADSSTWVQVGSVTVEQAASIFGQLFLSFGVDMATTGAIVPFAGGVLPSGWIPCDGRSLAVVDYPSLFAAIGNVWGAVDSSHFNIPDLRGRVLVGQGTGGGGTKRPTHHPRGRRGLPEGRGSARDGHGTEVGGRGGQEGGI